MVFYWILFFLVLLLAVLDRRKTYWIIFGILFLLAILRGESVGADLKGIYRTEFYTIEWDTRTWGMSMKQNEIGFSFIIAFFKTFISNNFLVCFNFVLGFSFALYGRYIYKYCKYPSMSLFFMLALAYYFECYNGMRQQFCDSILISYTPLLLLLDKKRKSNKLKKTFARIGISMNVVKLLQTYVQNYSLLNCNQKKIILSLLFLNKKRLLFLLSDKIILFIYSLLVIVTSFLFHKSQIIFLLFIPILYLYDTKFCKTKLLLIYLIISVLFSIPISHIAQKYFLVLSLLFQNDNSNIGGYLSYDGDFGEYSQFSNYLNTFFCMYVVYTHRYKQSFFLCLYVFGVILLDTLTPIFWIFQRIAFVFMFFRIMIFAEMMYEIPNKIERVSFIIAVLLYSVILFNRRLINDNFVDVVPYESFLF